jgi:hypothetical protein
MILVIYIFAVKDILIVIALKFHHIILILSYSDLKNGYKIVAKGKK